MPLLALILALQATAVPVAASFAPLTVYNGSWTVTGPQTMAGPGKPDHLTNHCFLTDTQYACEQVVNGHPLALLLFTSAGTPGHFHTQPIPTSGSAMGIGDLTIDGNHWTFSGKATSPDGKTTWFRTENLFTGADHIHYDQYDSTDGTTWRKTAEGEESRDKP